MIAKRSITIITATLNAAPQLSMTIESMRQQIGDEFEWLVVDGGSNDGTADLLRANDDLVSWWISEPDQGVYHAWNKACRNAHGEWLLFMGAGDEFASKSTLAQCAALLAQLPPDVTLAYGRQDVVSAVNRVTLETHGQPWKEIEGCWEIGRPALPPHGATFHRRRLFPTEPPPFDLRFRIAADAYFLLRVLMSPGTAEPAFLDITINRSPIGGLSFRLEALAEIQREIALIDRDLGLTPPIGHRVFEFCRRTAASVLCRLPRKLRGPVADSLRWIVGRPKRWSVS